MIPMVPLTEKMNEGQPAYLNPTCLCPAAGTGYIHPTAEMMIPEQHSENCQNRSLNI